MPSKFLESLRRQREELQQTLESITDLAASQERELSESEHQNVTDIAEKLGPLDQRIAEMNASEEARLRYLDDARRIDGLANGVRPAVSHPGGNPQLDARTWGEMFSESEALEIFRRGGGHGRSAAVDVGSFVMEKRVLTSQDLGVLVPPQVMPTVVEPPERSSILSLLRRATTRAEVIQYISEGEGTGKATVVPEGQPKPELTLAFESHTVTVSTIAAWIAATRQILDDAPQLRTYIDGRLREAVLKAIEDYVLNGATGTGNPGLLAGAVHVTGADMVQTVINAISAIEAAGYTPTGIMANGADWWQLVGSLYSRQTALGDLVMTGTVPRRVAGLPIVDSPSVPAGEVIVGDFRDGAVLWDREQSRLFVADQHSDFFVRNTLVVLCEARMGLAIYEPHAFAVGTIEGEEPEDRARRQASASTPPATERRRTA